MKELKLTENKIGSILYAVAYFGLMIFIKFSGDILLKLFPVEFLVKYFDPLIYAIFFVAAVGNSVGAILFWLAKTFKEKWAVLNK